MTNTQAQTKTQQEPTPVKEAQPLARVGAVDLTHDTSSTNARLKSAWEQCHLVTPVTQVDALPEGFGVSLSYVKVNPNLDPAGPGDVYEVGNGKVALGGAALKSIAAAAGVDWDPELCRRMDDGKEQFYCRFRAVGTVANFDGTPRRITGEVELDARDGAPLIEEIVIRAKNARDRAGRPTPRDPSTEIRNLRKFLQRHAETRAKLRAITDLGVRRAYAPADLSKPFAIARLVFTGQSNDPGLRRAMALLNARRFLGGSQALYGADPQEPALPPARFEPPVVEAETDCAEGFEPLGGE